MARTRKVSSSGNWQLLVVCLAVAGLLGGVAVGAREWRQGSDTNQQSEVSTDVDVLHNPPVLFEPGAPVTLEFELVCPLEACPAGEGEVSIVDRAGDKVTVTDDPDANNHFSFAVPDQAAAAGSFEYSVVFLMQGQDSVAWPVSGARMQALALADAVSVDIGEAPFGDGGLLEGHRVLTGPWGNGPGEFGLDDVGSGPTSFDVAPDGSLVVLDAWNSRLTWFMDGKMTKQLPIDLPHDYPDLAAESADVVDVLIPGGGTGQAKVLRYSGGESPQVIAMNSGRGAQIRARGDRVQVLTQSSNWVTVVEAGRPLTMDEQAGRTDVASTDGDARVYVKHVDEGSVLIEKVTDNGQAAAWRLSGDSWLGPVKLAESTDWGVILVQSVYSNTDSLNAIVQLFNDGHSSVTWVPQQQYAEMTANSDFRWADDALYAARSTKEGFTVFHYDVGLGGIR